MDMSRLALIIGNGAYENSPLKNPINDALDMAQALKKIDFEVIHKENVVEKKSMEESIYQFEKRLQKGWVGLFYFAGHGIQVNGKNYLIPTEAVIPDEVAVRYEAVDVDKILEAMLNAGNDLNIVILDACRDNPFARCFRSSIRGLAQIDAPKGSLIAYATSPGKTAADGDGRNGVYTGHLLRHMMTPGLKIEEILKRVRNDVLEETAGKQTPWESTSLRGEFYFIKPSEKITIKSMKGRLLWGDLSTALPSDKAKASEAEYEHLKKAAEKEEISGTGTEALERLIDFTTEYLELQMNAYKSSSAYLTRKNEALRLLEHYDKGEIVPIGLFSVKCRLLWGDLSLKSTRDKAKASEAEYERLKKAADKEENSGTGTEALKRLIALIPEYLELQMKWSQDRWNDENGSKYQKQKIEALRVLERYEDV
jgi:hypothetical protein